MSNKMNDIFVGDIVKLKLNGKKYIIEKIIYKNCYLLTNGENDSIIINNSNIVEIIKPSVKRFKVDNSKFTTVSSSQLSDILNEKDVFQRLEEVNINKYDVLIDSGLIDLGQILETDQRLIDNMEYVNEYFKMYNIKKITTNFIVEDIRDGLLYPEFDIVVYLNNIVMIEKYNNLYKVLKSNSNINSRKRLYTIMKSYSHSREVHNMLMNLDKKAYIYNM